MKLVDHCRRQRGRVPSLVGPVRELVIDGSRRAMDTEWLERGPWIRHWLRPIQHDRIVRSGRDVRLRNPEAVTALARRDQPVADFDCDL